ncbi:MAG TPA: SGNH/GDSL hydrolase family protein, partial [Porphyromonadaceae bacterium]|nr:SGNH/GDSL hydrolase family protein [Porphyromonadaceae bacterium]
MYKHLIIITIISFCCLSSAPRKIKWVAIGDSITYLNDHADETGHRVKKGYLTRVTEMLT